MKKTNWKVIIKFSTYMNRFENKVVVITGAAGGAASGWIG